MRGRGPGAMGSKKDPRDLEQLQEHPVSFRRVAALFKPHRMALSVVMVLIVATAIVGLATPFITKALIDHAVPDHDVPMLLWLVGGMLAVTVISSIFGVFQTWQSTLVGQHVMNRLRSDLFTHLQRQPLSFFTKTRGGDVQSRLTNDIAGMQTVVTNSATSVASNVTTAIGTAVAMVALSWQLSLLSLIVLPPAIWTTRKVSRMRRNITTRTQRALADLQVQVEESLSASGVLLSKTLGTGPALSERFAVTSAELVELEVRSQLAGRWRMATMSIVFAAIPAMLYLIAGLPATSHGMTIGTLVAFTALQAGLFRPLMGVLNVGIQVTASMALFSRIFEYIDLPVEIDDPANPVAIDTKSAAGHVRIENVDFRYPDADRLALAGIDLDVPAGTSLALVGETGSGKSTLAGLVARLQDPTVGAVTIDGIDIRDMTLTDISRLVGVVSQETYLLHTTVRENLRYAKPEATDAEIENSARAAQVHELIIDLPDGYDTMVGARGYRFSGGEKQRIAIARTLLRDPRVLVLDEATSALDNQTERAVQRALDTVSHGRTTITIAHRLSTIHNADQIAVLSHGEVIEIGSHDSLRETDGKYAALLDSDQSHLLSMA